VADLDIAPLTDESGFRLTGDLDFSTLPPFTAAVGAFPPSDELHLDLAEVIHVDSAGLHAILGLARSRSLILHNPTPTVMRSFEIAGIDLHPAIEIRHGAASTVARRTRSTRPNLRRAG
jgi:anti-anti-sigma regulatory factor